MSRPRFSIVVPTRNRAETLASTLKSCVSQDFEDYEVVVCDNCSDPQTRAVIDSVGGKRTVYVRSEVPLAMATNWELALSKYSGEFVIVVGDDDGLPPYALRIADELIRALNVKVLSARSAYYIWPGLEHPQLANESLQIPLPIPSVVKAARPALVQSVRMPNAGAGHPSLYNSFVHRDVVEAIRGPNGRVFNSSIPDWYSGWALMSRVERLGVSGISLHIAGISGKSNGNAVFSGAKKDVECEPSQLNAVQGQPWHDGVPEVPMSRSAISSECLEQVRDHLSLDPSLVTNPKRLLRSILKDLFESGWPIPPDTWASYVKEISRYAERHGLADWLRSVFPEVLGGPPAWKPPKQLGYGMTATHLNLHAARFGMRDVNGAAELMANVLLGGVDGKLTTAPEASAISKWTSATRELVKTGIPGNLFERLATLKASVSDVGDSLKDRSRARARRAH